MGKSLQKNRPPLNSGGVRSAPRGGGAHSAPELPPSGELLRYYEAMSGALGPMRWWPAQTPFEVIVGAILTQSTAWGNVERAIANLRSAGILAPSAKLRVRTPRLAAFVRPSGYLRHEAQK